MKNLKHNNTFRRAALTLLALMMTYASAWAQSGNWSAYRASAFSVINENAKTISITSEAELALLAYNTCNGTDYSGYTITLTKDLYMSAHYWDKSIGTEDINNSGDNSFRGTFNGANKTISGIYISSGSYKGLFGFVGQSQKPGTIQNVTLASSTITGKTYVGGIVGNLLNGTVSNCHVLSSVSILASSDYSGYLGGIVGLTYPNKTNTNATIENCTSAASVTDNGRNNCFNYGGIVGYNYYYSDTYFSKVTGCFYYGTAVSASSEAGAIVGLNYKADGTGISNCYYNYPSTISGIGYGNTNFGTTRVYKLTLGTGATDLTISGNATYTHNGIKYYAANTTATVATTNNNQVILDLSASVGTISNVVIANDKHSATFTIGSSDVADVTLTATVKTISGTCGNNGNVTWSLGGTNYTELTISGTGAMQNFGYTTVNSLWRTNAPWGWETLTTVTIGNGVTSIGNYAFIGCENIASVTIGSGVTSIGIGAINHCDEMITITLPASVTTIAYAAFENCQKLETIYINHDGEVSLTGNHANAFNAPLLQYIVFPSLTSALAHIQTTGNWAPYQTKIRARFGNQHFTATNEGGTPAYVIADATDLSNLATAVNGGSNGSGQTFRQTANISVGSTFPMIGTSETNSFRGIYDGNHKTLTFNYTATDGYTAPFRYVNGTSTAHAVIRDLNVSSTITSTDRRHPSGLVANQHGYLDVTGCNVTVNINTTVGTNNPNDLYPAGLVSQVAGSAQLNVSGCTVGGTITSSGQYASGMIAVVQGSATVSGCTVGCTINTSAKYAAGYVSTAQGSTSISNCVSSVTINSSVSGDGTHGGFVGAQSNTLTIEGCLFNGSLLGTTTNSCGGFVGWKNGTVNISNSLFAPASVNINTSDSYTFSRRSGTNITNCYYTQAFGEAQGTAARTVSASENVTTCTVSPVGNSTNSYSVSGITAYNDGLVRGSNFYYGNTDVVSLTLAHQEREGYNFDNYTASAGTLTGTNNPYSLTMPDSDVTINAIYTNVCPVPTNLTATDLTSTTATLSWSGEQDSYNVRYRTAGTENYTLFEDFENLGNELPEGWTFDGTYWIPQLDGGHNSTYYLCLVSHDEYLITPKMDLSGQGQAILNFWYRNIVSGAPVQFEVYYRTEEDDDAWYWLWSSEGGHAEWTEKTIDLPDLSANYQIGFYIVSGGGPDICFDDIAITGTSLHPVGDWQTVNNIAATTTPLTGLSSETTYEWQVQGLGCNGNGTSEWSEAGTFTTLNPCEIVPSELTATDITVNSATLNWNGEQESYNVRYRTAGTNDWQTVGDIAATTTTVTGLSGETSYEWQVRGLNCDGNGHNTEWSEMGTFTTEPCVVPSELTATEPTFTTATLNWNGEQDSYNVRYRTVFLAEGFESGTMPAGWTRTGSYWSITAGTGWDYAPAATGNYNAGCYIPNNTDTDTLITPVMDLSSAASATLSFNFWNTDYSHGDINTLNVYYRVDGGQWHLLYTNTQVTVGYFPVTVPLEGFAANYQLGFECVSDWSYGMAIDDVLVIDDGEWTTENDVTNPFNLTNLTSDTQYAWQVQGSNCDGNGGTTEWSEMGYFTTLNPCETPYGLAATNSTATTATLNWSGLQDSYNVRYQPADAVAHTIFTEGFEGGAMPYGWSQTSSYWQVTSGTGCTITDEDYTNIGAATGNYNAGCYIPNYDDTDTLITPALDLSNVASATLKFNFWNPKFYSDINTLNVYYRVNGGQWHLLYTYDQATNGWIPVTVTLEGLAANYQIGFECVSHWSYGMGIDDVMVIEYGEWTTENDVTSPLTITGLTPDTQYAWQVQGINTYCDNGTTEWSEMGYFTTQPLPAAIPYIDGNGVVQYKQPGEYTVLTGGGATTLSPGWYVVNSDITYTGTVTITETVRIILCNGYTMNIGTEGEPISSGKGITTPVTGNPRLHIYGQTLDDNDAGHLKIYTAGQLNAGIKITGYYTQHSGNVSITTTGDAANGIFVLLGNGTLNGGTLNVSTANADAISASSGNIIINGGKLDATTSFSNRYGLSVNPNYTITFGWTNASDRIKASRYYGTVNIAQGKAFADEDGNIYSGNGITGIDGKTLHPLVNAVTRTIEGYDDSTTEGWVFISSPVSESIAPNTVANIFSATEYDLYRFNQSAANGKEWENYKATTSTNHADFISLVNGQGYLYATKQTKTLAFSGDFNDASSQKVPLAYNSEARFAGWNLVGNPFTVDAYVNRPFYQMNEAGTGIEPIDTYNNYTTPISIPPCTGIMVQAGNENDTVVFSTSPSFTAPYNGGLSVTLSQVVEPVNPSLTNVESDDLRGTKQSSGDDPSTGSGTSTLDKAIVSFNEGAKLGKFYFGTQDANIYIPQGNEEYAIAYSEGQGEMPLNFKAVKNGTYTISVNPEGVAFSYLHLIDNMTGADVDLLTPPAFGHPLSEGDIQPAPSYTFEAKTTDYESRFRLVFNTDGDGPSTGSGTFAYIDANGNIIITCDLGDGEGDACNASLQVVDVMGRVIRCRDAVTASQTIPTSGMAPGVYILRLINGDNVKTQKIVVK